MPWPMSKRAFLRCNLRADVRSMISSLPFAVRRGPIPALSRLLCRATHFAHGFPPVNHYFVQRVPPLSVPNIVIYESFFSLKVYTASPNIVQAGAASAQHQFYGQRGPSSPRQPYACQRQRQRAASPRLVREPPTKWMKLKIFDLEHAY